jgi:hypothetical protein
MARRLPSVAYRLAQPFPEIGAVCQLIENNLASVHFSY